MTIQEMKDRYLYAGWAAAQEAQATEEDVEAASIGGMVTKFNLNHDELGQFADRPSGGPTRDLADDTFAPISVSSAKRQLAPGRKVTPKEKQSIAGYSTLGSDMINNNLRSGKGKFDRQETIEVPDPMSDDEDGGTIMLNMGTAVKNLDAVIASTSVKKNILVYRGEAEGPPPGIKVGMTFTDHGYTSTSINKGGGYSMKREITIEIPKGAKALMLESIRGMGINDEEEVLLPRGTRFQVTKITKTGWHARVLL